MIYGYARVSKREQNLDLQIDALKKHGVDKIYYEKVSGTKATRDELTKLLKMLKKGDTLVIWKLDRLGRTSKQLISLAEEFEARGILFISLNECLDTTNPIGKFCFHIFCAIAQMERDVIVLRTIEGLESARSRGRKGGRKPINQDNIKQALNMYNSDEYTVNQITRCTGISKSSLYRYLRSQNINNSQTAYISTQKIF